MNAITPMRVRDSVRDTLQRPLHDLRLSLVSACNYRCPYCMPAEGEYLDESQDAAARLGLDEIEVLARAFLRVGVRKIRLTGGEPLLRKDLPEIIRRLVGLPGLEDLALTTNGSLLAGKAVALREAGLHRLTVSLDALDAEVFRAMSGGRGEVDDVLQGIAAAERAGFERIKINCVVQRGVNDDQVLKLAARFRGTPHVLRFIEFMDVGTCNRWSLSQVVNAAELHARIHAQWPLRPLSPSYRGEVAERHAYVDGAGEIGFVHSISVPFCGDCHRARVSSEGHLFTCLFASEGLDLRPALAQGEAVLADRLSVHWRQRTDRYSESRAAASRDGKRIEMFYIGG